MLNEIIFLIILLILSGFFSASETAFYSVDRFKLEKLVKKKVNGSKNLSQLKSNQNKLLITILVLNNVVNIAAASIATTLALKIFPDNYAVAVSTFIITIFVLIFGEITPKSFATKHSVKLALSISGLMVFLVWLLSPITWLLEKLTKFLVGNFNTESLTEEEIKLVVALGHKEGAIDKEEKEIIQRVFRLDDISVGDIMTPRVEMVAVEKNQTLKNLKKFLKDTPYSKIPVYSNEKDNIVGIFNIRDSLKFMGRKLDVKVSSLMTVPLFVPQSKKLRDLLNEFQRKKVHIAIVVGEYGGVLGVVTLEDILEELVGEIIEDKDDEFEMKVINEKTLVVDGGTELENVNKELEINLVSKEYTTIAGFLLEKIDRFPRTNEKFTFNNIKFEIIKAKRNKIEQVRITK